MSRDALLRVDRLRLQNFRCFADCAIELDPDLTVLVAENGQGKTAILDGVAIAMGLFVDTIAGTRQFRGFDRTDIRLTRSADGHMSPALPTRFEAEGYVDGKVVRWSRALTGYGLRARTSSKDADGLRRAADVLREGRVAAVETGPLNLPLVAFYGTGRLWSEHRLTEGKKSLAGASGDRFAAYVDCLSSSSSFKGMAAWYESKMGEIGDSRFATDLRTNVPLITAVREAARLVLGPTGWSELDWDPSERSLVASHAQHGRLPLSTLSDGVRNMTALVADVARRCATLNPHLREDAARQTPGVLLIDEVDMHLHPRWQQLIVDLLRQAFPAVQLILTTHSPHVLSTVDKQSIRVIRLQDGEVSIDSPTLQTRGVQSADVLSSIMGVDPVPQIHEAQELSRYRALIEDGLGESIEAQNLRSGLAAHFGKDHPLILDCDRLIRFQAFRLRRDGSGEN
jgi:predicted ATP-binding protein involved in virulence